MKVYELNANGIDIQCEVILCYYDYEINERVFLTEAEASDREIKYLYVENDCLVIEVEGGEEE